MYFSFFLYSVGLFCPAFFSMFVLFCFALLSIPV